MRGDSVRDCIDDVEDTHKISVSLVREVGGGLVVLGLGIVDFGNALSLGRLKDTRWGDVRAIKDFPASLPFFTLVFELGSILCWRQWARRYSSSVIRTHFQLLLELGISQVRLARFAISFF